MKALKARICKGLNHGSRIICCDNSGAKLLKIVSVRGGKPVKGRAPAAGVGDYILASVVQGKPDIRIQVVPAVIVRQRKEYRRANGIRIRFEDNAAVVLKDEFGNLRGT
ncbi:MAG: uL14 family ribosomal protein, partial [Candidatus Woesearchaeota archaeon]